MKQPPPPLDSETKGFVFCPKGRRSRGCSHRRWGCPLQGQRLGLQGQQKGLQVQEQEMQGLDQGLHLGLVQGGGSAAAPEPEDI